MQESKQTGKRDPRRRAARALHDLACAGVMAALSILLCRFLGFPREGIWRVDPGVIPIAMVGFLSGPLWAGMAYGVADLIGAAIFTGVNPFITLEKIVLGVILGVGFYRRDRLGVPRILLTLLVAAVLCDFLAMSFIFIFSFGTPPAAAFWMRGLNAAVNFAMRSLLLILCDRRLFAVLRRRGGAYFGSI